MAASIAPVSSSTKIAASEVEPCKRSGIVRHCEILFESSASRTRTCARRRLPLAASAAVRAACGIAPSRIRSASRSSSVRLLSFISTHLDIMVVSCSGKSSAVRRKIVFCGGSSRDLRSADAEGDAPVVVSSTSSMTTIW